MKIQCLKCKGRGFCGRIYCPILAKTNAFFKIKNKLEKQEFYSASPSIFVGRHNYPYLNIGILAPPENTQDIWLYDAQTYWADHNFQIQKIIQLRSSLINSRFKLEVKQSNKLLDISKEIAMAIKPVDVEINLKEKPKPQLNFPPYLLPIGPNAKIKQAKITSNPKIPKIVEKAVDAQDLKAHNSIISLYEHGLDENQLAKLLSTANLGLKTQRKLVPTRWAITAVDDIIAKKLISDIKNYEKMHYSLYFGSYLGNYYLALFMPEIWQYELFETYLPKSSWNISSEIQTMTDYEPYEGRKTYAEQTGGGYYAARLSVLEKLSKLKKQASALVLRFITGEYYCPLGVWVCRSAIRKALNTKPLTFKDKNEMLRYVKQLIQHRFRFNADYILKRSKILNKLKTQPKLTAFL